MINKLFCLVKNKPQPVFLEYPKNCCAITRKVIEHYNTLSEQEFLNRYSCYKRVYAKRVARYGDPYMKAPGARIGKFLAKIGN